MGPTSFPLTAFLLLALGAPAPAQDSLAAYPPLPASVSSITVSDRQGRRVGRILPQKRYWVTLDRIPEFLQKSLLAVEDARFYEHGGIDIRGIARALVTDVAKGRVAEGGSTITQQLIKNKFLSAEVSIDRKVKEARMAMEFEKKYSKRQILEMYFNEIYYGNGTLGLAQAARLYFDKSPEALSPVECVMLAGVPKNPGRYNPMGKPADVAGRLKVVLNRLVGLRIISPQQAQELSRPGPVQPPALAPQYLAQVRATLVERYGADITEQGGLEVTAALDLDLQRQAEQALRAGVKRIAPGLQGALVCLDPATGDVLAAVGDVNGDRNSINRAFVSRRQPGSAIKPLIYAAALETGITAGSIWNDAPAVYSRGNGESWRPTNFAGEQFGELSLRQALAHSDNVIAVKVLDRVGVPYFIDFAGRMGLPLQARNGLSLALGTEEVTLNALVQAYTPLAAAGVRAESRTLLRIHDRRQGTWTEQPPALAPVLAPAAAYITTRMLGDVMAYGTAKTLKGFGLAHPSAGKTGTTSDYRDAWFIGYTPQLLTGVWVGYDQPRPGGRGFTGGAIAAPIWERFMVKALVGKAAADFPRPDTVVTVPIEPATGLRAAEGSPTARDEFYIAGTEPAPDSQAGSPKAPVPSETAEPGPMPSPASD